MSRKPKPVGADTITLGHGLRLHCQWKAKPSERLRGLSPAGLFHGAGPTVDLEQAWYVGSTVNDRHADSEGS